MREGGKSGERHVGLPLRGLEERKEKKEELDASGAHGIFCFTTPARNSHTYEHRKTT